jgi:protein-S-isoprenylcysteine O-methyltransferase Ste14
MNSLFLRAVIAFLALPGMVAFVIPLFFVPPGASRELVQPWGVLPLMLGLAVLALTVREFYVSGKGTLAPWSPPQKIVVSGLYHYSRNPMYVGVLLILCGWAIGFWSWALALYAIGIAIAFQVRVIVYEEPWLARLQPQAWDAYRMRVPRWIGVPR